MLLRTTTNLCLGMALAFTLVNCAHKPPEVETISATQDPSTEITQTDKMLHDGREAQLDVLSPKNFTNAEKSLEKAKELRSDNKPNEKILEQVAYSRGWLKEAQAKGDVARASMTTITDARSGAWHAGADKNYPTEWNKLEKDTKEVTSDIEKGKLPKDKESAELTQRYHSLEVKTIETTSLGKAQINLKTASDQGAAKLAPKTYTNAEDKYKKADDLIKADPRNSSAINAAAAEATTASEKLVSITSKVKGAAGSTEDLVLNNEDQAGTISNLETQNTETSGALATTASALQMQEERTAALAKRTAVNDKAEKIRSEFNPNEAEVFTEGSKILIRLKGLQFATNKAVIPAKSKGILDRVDSAIKDNNLAKAKISVQGHTDGVGSRSVNMALSEKRAQAVQEYLIANGDIPRENIEAKGVGFAKPTADNKTAETRAQNRTIDVVIETTAPTAAE